VPAGRRYCVAHTVQLQRKTDGDRQSSTARGYGTAWRKARVGHLIHHPLCAECLRHNHTRAAVAVDHVVPHRGNQALFWTTANWQSLCVTCHASKSARERL
jgi:5-methylcytosine-specific restriction protein A